LTAGTAYTICTLAQLDNIRSYRDKYFIQKTDIDAADTAVNPGPNPWNTPSGWVPLNFVGVYDGEGHTISNLYIYRPAENYIALFGDIIDTVDVTGTLMNIGLLNVNITGGLATGGLAGIASAASITNSYVTGGVTGTRWVGGLVGYAHNGIINNSYSEATVISVSSDTDSLAGGLAGYAKLATIDSSYATGSVNGNKLYVGGLTGYAEEANVSNSYATGDTASDSSHVGGLLAYALNATITNCYATGNVTAGSYSTFGVVGGLAGVAGYATVSNSFSTGNVHGNIDSDDNVGVLFGYSLSEITSNLFYSSEASVINDGTGLLTDHSTFANGETILNLQNTTTPHPVYNTWDFTTVWQENPGGFPTLR